LEQPRPARLLEDPKEAVIAYLLRSFFLLKAPTLLRYPPQGVYDAVRRNTAQSTEGAGANWRNVAFAQKLYK
jgi:hypothetical protein